MADNQAIDRQIVESLLSMSGITAGPGEIDQLVVAYAKTRTAVEALYAMPGVRYEEPAVTFDPRI